MTTIQEDYIKAKAAYPTMTPNTLDQFIEEKERELMGLYPTKKNLRAFLRSALRECAELALQVSEDNWHNDESISVWLGTNEQP